MDLLVQKYVWNTKKREELLEKKEESRGKRFFTTSTLENGVKKKRKKVTFTGAGKTSALFPARTASCENQKASIKTLGTCVDRLGFIYPSRQRRESGAYLRSAKLSSVEM